MALTNRKQQHLNQSQQKEQQQPYQKTTTNNFRRSHAVILIVTLSFILLLFLCFDVNVSPNTLKRVKKVSNKKRKNRNYSAHHQQKIIDKGATTITYDKLHLVYGTAWKKERTAELVAEAIKYGFRFFDTASAKNHYNEVGVGEGWTNAVAAADGDLLRNDLYLQSKFSRSKPGKDDTGASYLPYDVTKPINEQVIESFSVSLSNLQTNYLDAYVLHSPYPNMDDTYIAWEAMETFVDEGTVRLLGVSNFYDFDKFKSFYEKVRIKPSIVQNRFYEKSNFDTELREFCTEKNILYQSFWTLTANRKALKSPVIIKMAYDKRLTPETLMYVFMMALPGHITPLDGTTNMEHMQEDLEVEHRIAGGENILTKKEIKTMAKIIGVPM